MTTIPVAQIAGFIWGEHVLVVVEHSFAIRAATLISRYRLNTTNIVGAITRPQWRC